MTMLPDQLMDAIHFAEFVMAKEKKDRIGSSAATVYPMKFFLFHDQMRITDQLRCQPMEASGRFMQVWALETWMGPHFAVNMPVILKALGKEVDQKYVKIARVAKEMAPPNYPFVRLNVKDIASVLKKMRLEEN